MPRQPYIAFYVGDWKRSADVQSLPYSERGIWFEMLCLMHDSPQRGELSHANGSPMADDEIARLLGLSKQDFTNALTVLLRKGVTERNEHGALINRRMVRERLLSDARKRAGKAGADSRWGSKALAEAWQAYEDEIDLLGSSVEERKKLREACEQWQEFRQKRAQAPKDWLLYWQKQLKFLSQYSVKVAIDIIETSIRNDYQGLFPPKSAPQVNGHHHAKPEPVWAQIKAVEGLIGEADRQLRAIPNRPQSVWPKEFEQDEAKRKPLRERKVKLTEQLNRLKAQQAGEAHD